MQLFKIISETVKAELTHELLDAINNTVITGVKYTKRSIIASIRAHTGYEISVSDDDRTCLCKILHNIDPLSFKKYAITTTDEYSDDFYSSLRNNISYFIPLPKIRTFIYVSTYAWEEANKYSTADEVHVFICGLCSTELYELFQSILRPHEEIEISSSSSRRGIYGSYDIVLDSNKDVSIKAKQIKKTKLLSQIMTNPKNIENLTGYLDQWLQANEFFVSKGLAFKLGILFYGPPGTGKTTLAQALAAHYHIDMFILSASDFSQKVIDKLKKLELAFPKILLIEDIDYIFGRRENEIDKEQREQSNLLLQFLDGTHSIQNLITIATTNDIDSLDPAIIRPGRFDLKVHMDNINKEQAQKLVDELNITTVPFVLQDNATFNPASLQNMVIQHVFKNIEQIKKEGEETDGGNSETDDMESSPSCQ